MLTVLIAVALAAGIAYGLLLVAPEATTRWLDRILRARRVLGGLFVIVFALVAISSGYLPLMLVGFAILLGASLVALTSYSLADIRRRVGV